MGKIKCCKELKITAPPNEWSNIPFCIYILDFLTFGEFCIFATELSRHYVQAFGQGTGSCLSSNQTKPVPVVGCGSERSRAKKVELLRTGKSSAYDVFLGGSCNPTTWRQDTAIPYFKSQGITYYNPQQSNWVPEMIELEHQAKQVKILLKDCSVMLFTSRSAGATCTKVD